MRPINDSYHTEKIDESMQFSPEIAENVRGSEDDSVVVFLSVFSQDIDADIADRSNTDT